MKNRPQIRKNMTYKQQLEEWFLVERQHRSGIDEQRAFTKLEFLGESVFDFTTYDSDMDVLFASKMIEVLKVLVNRITVDYVYASEENYLNYITMVNMPFLAGKLEWGTSIRGAWIDNYSQNGDHKIGDIIVLKRELEQFLTDLIEWAETEVTTNP